MFSLLQHFMAMNEGKKLIQNCSLSNVLASFEEGGYFITKDHKKSLKLIKQRLSRKKIKNKKKLKVVKGRKYSKKG